MTGTEIGSIGEEIVCGYLIEQGYNIIARNYRIRGGEIDIIAVNPDYIAFVEVKSRKPGSMVGGFEAVNRRKQGLIIKTASDYCTKYPTELQPRFDIAEVIIDNGRVLSIDYIQNAYDTTGYNFIF
ncbi:MAG: YraN family protein [Ruminococcus flavefaciens]|nr:YraN family protein [Ruminococcus flavefaciens]MCM1229759.1 YraN family protein [Ruminococcus flavefaciens]